ncbi:hypothetical protein [Olleya sp. R77988]|uniref:hypothetical protein n=1 Tax=Olleya sp. R77988 TaxID=3093875 RepID=UPI0037C6F721
MKSDSFENFGRYKKLVSEKLAEFILEFENSPERIKNLIHYQSVINISREIIRFNNSEFNNLKEQILKYFEIVKEIDFLIDENNYEELQKQKMESRKRYNKYIFPAGSILMTESGFKTKLPIGFYLFIGIIMDFIIYYSFSKDIVPLSSIVFLGVGILFRKRKNNKNKVFGLFK